MRLKNLKSTQKVHKKSPFCVSTCFRVNILVESVDVLMTFKFGYKDTKKKILKQDLVEKI